MALNNKVRMLAGFMVLLSLGLSRIHSEYWLLLTAFVGLNLLQSSVTHFCPAEYILAKIGPTQK